MTPRCRVEVDVHHAAQTCRSCRIALGDYELVTTAELVALRRELRKQERAVASLAVQNEKLRVGMESLIRACRRSGTCTFCGVALSTMHDAECPVLDAVIVLEPAFGAALEGRPNG